LRSLLDRSPLSILADEKEKFGFHYERVKQCSRKFCWRGFLVCVQCSGDNKPRADDYVRGYFRSNGTYVAPHFRSHPDHNFYNNWSTYPNINPYTGQMGMRLTPSYSPYPSYGFRAILLAMVGQITMAGNKNTDLRQGHKKVSHLARPVSANGSGAPFLHQFHDSQT
jgi:hypothetical protein